MKILLVNTAKNKCGVHQFGFQVYRCLKGNPNYQIIHGTYDNPRNFLESVVHHMPTHILVNWHEGVSTAWWLTNEFVAYLREQAEVKFLLMPHDEIVRYDRNLIDHIFWLDPTKQLEGKDSILGRPIIPIERINSNPNIGLNKKLTVGYSGFLFSHKRVEKIKEIVGDRYCHFRFHFAPSDYGREPEYEKYIRDLFKGNENQTSEFITDFLTCDQVTEFLAGNNINIFPYEDTKIINRGISSIVDNALSANRPFMVSNSIMFRHLKDIDDKINYNKISFDECLSNGVSHLQKYRELWSPENMQKVIMNAISA